MAGSYAEQKMGDRQECPIGWIFKKTIENIFSLADIPISTGSTAGHRSRIDKNTEKASPGYYSLDLVDFDIKTELTSTTRCGFFWFTFPETNEGLVFFNLLFPQEYETKILDTKIIKVSDTEIEGYSKQTSVGFNDDTLHFVARFNKPFKLFGGWEEKNVVSNVQEITRKEDVGA